jgi:hypothetical protein
MRYREIGGCPVERTDFESREKLAMDIYGISGRCFQRFLSDMGVGDSIEKIFAGYNIIGTPFHIVFPP